MWALVVVTMVCRSHHSIICKHFVLTFGLIGRHPTLREVLELQHLSLLHIRCMDCSWDTLQFSFQDLLVNLHADELCDLIYDFTSCDRAWVPAGDFDWTQTRRLLQNLQSSTAVTHVQIMASGLAWIDSSLREGLQELVDAGIVNLSSEQVLPPHLDCFTFADQQLVITH